MSSTRYARSLRIEPQPSSILKWFLIVNFAGAMLILFIVFSVFIALPISLFLCGCFYSLYRHSILQQAPQSIRMLVRETSGEWFLYMLDGAEQEVTLSPSSYIHPQLIILILRSKNKRYTLLLLRDSIPTDCFRTLSVWLKMGAGAKLV